MDKIVSCSSPVCKKQLLHVSTKRIPAHPVNNPFGGTICCTPTDLSILPSPSQTTRYIVWVPLFLPRRQGDGFFLEEADSSTSKSKNKRKKNKAKKKSKGAGTTDDDAEGAAAAAAAATAAAAEMAGEEGDVSRRRRLGGT